jgi:glycosyltransferase involved in cell wall biosynthesis
VRVLHVYRTYFPDSHGGIEQVIRQICLSTRQSGVDSRVLALSADPTPGVIKRPEAMVYRLPLSFEVASCGISLGALGTFRKQVRWADVVHYHFPWPFADFLHFAANVDRPTVLTYHSDIVRQRLLALIYRPMMNRFLGSVSKIVCTSPNYFATSDVLNQFSDKVEVVPIGLDEKSYPDVGEDLLSRTEQKFGSDFFLFVGVLRYYKGLHILLEAIRDAPYQVVVVGAGPMENELIAQAETLGLDNLTLTGYVEEPEKVALFKLARAVVFPSYLRAEAFGVTLLEGAMHSKPLISTEVGSGTSYVNLHEETGLVVAPGNVSALRAAMDTLYQRTDVAKIMGQQARNRFEQLFTDRLMGERYVQAYRDLAGTKPLASVASLE